MYHLPISKHIVVHHVRTDAVTSIRPYPSLHRHCGHDGLLQRQIPMERQLLSDLTPRWDLITMYPTRLLRQRLLTQRPSLLFGAPTSQLGTPLPNATAS